MTDAPVYGSDVVVDTLAALGVRHVSLNPGASTRGLHESLVHAGSPEPVLALHEEIAVAMAHGYAKVAGRPMAVLLHDLVGLQHATMAIFNAWVDRVPVLLVGGSGPADAADRRPWLDWIHSPQWQALAVRDMVKWDQEPRSDAAVVDALVRAHRIATSAPCGPTYVAIDVAIQEARSKVRAPTVPPTAPAPIVPPPERLDQLAAMLDEAEFPVLLADLVGASEAGYAALRRIAETLGAAVVDLGARHNFPSDHWADASDDRVWALERCDLAVCLDVRDTAWALHAPVNLETRRGQRLLPAGARVVRLGLGELQHRGYVDREGPIDVDLELVGDTAAALPLLVGMLRTGPGDRRRRERVAVLGPRVEHTRAAAARRALREAEGDAITPAVLALELGKLLDGRRWVLANGVLDGWPRRLWEWDRFGCYLGRSGGEGLGYGMGAAAGAALALEDEDVLVVNVQADGDLLYTPSALWTCAQRRLPVLTVVANNRTYGKDRLHQLAVSQARDRGTEARVSVGIDIDDPPIDFARLAESQGVAGFGPLECPGDLASALQRALAVVESGSPALVDVVLPRPTAGSRP